MISLSHTPGYSRARLSLRHIFALVVCLCAVTVMQARQGAAPLSRRGALKPLGQVRQLVLTPTDVRAELASDERVAGKGLPLRFAAPVTVHVTPQTDGTWEDAAGGRVWRLRIHSAGATDLNFGFSSFHLPEGATFHIWSEGEDYFQGPYDSSDNKPHRELWTPVIPGDRAVLELFVPNTAREEADVLLTQVNRGYRDMFHRQKDLSTPKAGTCNIDVVCPQTGAWSNEVRSVARYTLNGSTLCTGTLINDVAGDRRSFFLTANHCGISAANASSVVVYWNYQSPSCGLHSGGSLNQNQSGATFRMAKSDVDVTLIELDAIPDSTFNVYYTGWDRTTNATLPGVVGIHHPNGDEKSISFSSNSVTVVSSCIGTGGSSTHYNVVWSSGVTEPGSSGSAIWDINTHRLVGTLSGGDSACATPTGPDCYGRFSVAWASGTTPATRLKDWLDPANTGTMSVSSIDPALGPNPAPAGWTLAAENTYPMNGALDAGELVTINLAVRNTGRADLTNVTGTLLAGSGVRAPSVPQPYSNVIAGGNATARGFSFSATGQCGGIILARLQLQSGTNPAGTLVYPMPLGVPVLAETFDATSWPNLPVNWTTNGVANSWTTTSTRAFSSSNSVFAADLDKVSEASLTSPSFLVPPGARLTFFHRYDTEATFDGGVLEISITNGAFADFLAAGGSFLSGGYNNTISTNYSNPLSGRSAWTGASTIFTNTVAAFPAGAVGKPVHLRWRIGSDSSVGAGGWHIDDVYVIATNSCCDVNVPMIVDAKRQGQNLSYSYNTASGRTYVSEVATSLLAASWTPFATNAGDGLPKRMTNSFAAPYKYIRVRSQ